MRLLPRDPRFFELLTQQADLLRTAAARLRSAVEQGDADWEPVCREIGDIETRGDEVLRETIRRLSTTFITPIDPEDIHKLTIRLDDALDTLDSLAQRIRIFGVGDFPPPMVVAAVLLDEGAGAVRDAVGLLGEDRDVTAAADRVHDVESRMDRVYRDALYDLFRSGVDAVRLVGLKETYDRLERAADRYAVVAHLLQEVRLKNA